MGDLEDLGVFDRREAQEQRASRRKVCDALAEFLRIKKKTQQSTPSAGRLAQECLEWLASSPAQMVLVNLEDLWGETAPQNVPGTSEERPNWKRKSRYSLEEFVQMRRIMNALRRMHRLRSSLASKAGKSAPA